MNVLPRALYAEPLFASRHHLVKASLFAGDAVFVTFQSATKVPGLHRPGFGEEFFRKRGISAIHVIPAQCAWYQHQEILELCATIREAVKPYRRVITYGSSMGGYAAINFAHRVGATDVIAISPQYSINPKVAPADDRYVAALKRMPHGFVYDQPERDWNGIGVNILHDPFDDLDAYQVRLAIRDIPARLIRLKYAGHPVTQVLSVNSLKDFLLSYPANPKGAVSSLGAAYKGDRAASWHYWMCLARRCGRSPRRLRCAQQAARLNPSHPHPYLLIGKILLLQGCPKEAVHAFNKASGADRRMHEPYIGKAKAFISLGLLDRARAAIDEAKRRRAPLQSIGALEVMLKRALLLEDADGQSAGCEIDG